MLLLIGLLISASVAMLSFELLRSRPRSLRYRVTPDGVRAPDPMTEDRTRGSLGERVIGPALRRGGRRISRLLPANILRAVSRTLVAADEPWSLPGFIAVWALSIGAGALLWVYIAAASGISPVQVAVIGLLIMPIAIALPYARIRSRARARQKAIVRALPDAMDLLVTSVEAGMGVDAAFALVTEKTEGPLSATFASYLKQVGLGRSRRDALLSVAARSGVSDLIEIANNISQGEQLGTPVGDVLRVQSEDLRARRRERAQIAAQRAPVLMTIPLATCFLPAMVAVVIVPSVLNLIDFVGNLGG